MAAPRVPRGGNIAAWENYFLRQLPAYLWPLGEPMPGDVYRRLERRYTFDWFIVHYPMAPYFNLRGLYNRLYGLAVGAIDARYEMLRRARVRPATAFDPERFNQIFAYQTLDDNVCQFVLLNCTDPLRHSSKLHNTL